MIDYTLLKNDPRFMPFKTVPDKRILIDRLEEMNFKLDDNEADWTCGLSHIITETYIATAHIVSIDPGFSYVLKWGEARVNLQCFFVTTSTGKDFYAIDLVEGIGDIEMSYDNGFTAEEDDEE